MRTSQVIRQKKKAGYLLEPDLGFASNYGLYDGKVTFTTATGSTSVEVSGGSVSLNSIVGLRAGYQYYFNAYNGIRAYGNFTYGNFGSSNRTAAPSLMHYGASLDYLLNFSNGNSPWGLFLGAGYEFISGEAADFFENQKKDFESYPGISAQAHNKGFFMNVGFSKIIQNHHRVEFGARIPFFKYLQVTTKQGGDLKITLDNLFAFYVAYSYSF